MHAPLTVHHEPSASRFCVQLDGHEAVLQYHQTGTTLDLYHTEVPPAFRGQGIAGQLCRAAFEYARANRLMVVPSCPYITGTYLKHHPEYAPLTQSR